MSNINFKKTFIASFLIVSLVILSSSCVKKNTTTQNTETPMETETLKTEIELPNGIISGSQNLSVISYKNIPYMENGNDYNVLTVFSNNISKKYVKRPVIIYFYGEPYKGSENPLYDGTNLTNMYDDLVFITVNHSSTNFTDIDFTKTDTIDLNDPSTFYMLKEHLSALKWVYDNVELFNGDKDNITVMSDTFGAEYVKSMLLIDNINTRIKKAILLNSTHYLNTLTSKKYIDMAVEQNIDLILGNTKGSVDLDISRKEARNHQGGNVYVYSFDAIIENTYIPPEQQIVAFALNNIISYSLNPSYLNLANLFNTSITKFTRKGNPGTSDLTWHQFNYDDNNTILELSGTSNK